MDNMWQRPDYDTHHLRPILESFRPGTFDSVDAQACVNFRVRARTWHLKNGHKPVGMQEARELLKDLSRPQAAAHETLDTDDPFVKTNLRVMLEMILSSANCTWHALRYLEECKKTAVGFYYRIWYKANGEPMGICWMSPEMRSDILRFGRLLFLDAKKSQYNNVGWPYIGPTVKDDEMKVCVVGESILTAESHSAYEWVLLYYSITQMEPRFKFCTIKYIFTDQLITVSLLKQLGIEKTCTLWCDYHHILNEAWPKYFGTFIFTKHSTDFRNFLVGSKEQWVHVFQQIPSTIAADANKTEYLLKIYQNPNYYAGWWLRNQEGHLNLQGSVSAEQNHASIKAHLGDGATWYVADHARRLVERQSRLTPERRIEEAKHYHTVRKYQSMELGQCKVDKENAKTNLSGWAYTHLYKVAT
jgi:hypothetical protein